MINGGNGGNITANVPSALSITSVASVRKKRTIDGMLDDVPSQSAFTSHRARANSNTCSSTGTSGNRTGGTPRHWAMTPTGTGEGQEARRVRGSVEEGEDDGWGKLEGWEEG